MEPLGSWLVEMFLNYTWLLWVSYFKETTFKNNKQLTRDKFSPRYVLFFQTQVFVVTASLAKGVKISQYTRNFNVFPCFTSFSPFAKCYMSWTQTPNCVRKKCLYELLPFICLKVHFLQVNKLNLIFSGCEEIKKFTIKILSYVQCQIEFPLIHSTL